MDMAAGYGMHRPRRVRVLFRSWGSFAILTFSQQAPSRYKTSRPPTKREIQTSMVTLYWIAA